MINLLWSGFVMVLLLSGCGWSGTPTRQNDFAPLTSIEIVADAPAIAGQTSTRLKAIGNYSGLFTRDITDQAVWSSDTPTVAAFVTPAEPSRVTGVAPGSATLTASVGNVSAPFGLTVTSATVTGVTISPAAPNVATGLTIQFRATGTFSDSTTQDLTFDSAWASSDATVATVGNEAGNKGLARALAAGTATISATFGGISGTTPLTVTEPVLQSITISPSNPSVLSISRTTFTATGTYTNGTTADITALAAWGSSNTDIAPNPTAGATTTSAQGTTSISATLNGVTGATTLKVTGGNLKSFTLPTDMTLVKGTAGFISVTGTFSNGSSRDITSGLTWSVANTNFATVDTPTGSRLRVNALAPGATTITAQSGSHSLLTKLTVNAPALKTFTIAPSSLDLIAGTSGRLTATATFNDGTTQDVTASTAWSSNAPDIAAVGPAVPSGERINGVAAGNATITATFDGQNLKAPVTVRTRTLATLTIAPTGTTTVAIGNQATFKATAGYSDGTTMDVTEDATWTTDNANVAIPVDSLNQPGLIAAVDGGSTPLRASFGGKSKDVTVRVP